MESTVASTIGQSILTEIVGSLVRELQKMVSEAAGSLRGVDNEIESIKEELIILSTFLMNAQQKSEGVREDKNWLKQVRTLVYDIEDCIEESILHLGQLDDKDVRTDCLRRIIHQIRKLWVCCRICNETKTLETRVKWVRKRGKLCLTTNYSGAITITSGAPHLSRLAGQFVEDAELVGINDRKDKLIGWLLAEDERQQRVISVVGMGGLGKTTLVRKVYESPGVSDGRFPNRAWINVSQTPDVKDLLKNMAWQLISPDPMEMVSADVTRLIEILRSHLQNQKYMVVLDDVWTVDHWELFKSALPPNTLGSRIIVTTRDRKVADTCVHGHGRPYELDPLTPEQSWYFFCKTAFDSPSHSCPPHLKVISENILDKCAGLPLAIATIGGLLAVEPSKTPEAWQKLLGRLSHIDPSLDKMTQLLNLSFDDLPPHLKRCFLYLSLFPKGYSIGRKRLVRLWVALGFVTRTPPDATLEEAAEDYFNELISRNLIQPSELAINGKVRSCRVHDVVREIIIPMSEEEMSISMCGLKDDTRHLSVHGNDNGSSSHECIPDVTRLAHIRLRTLLGDGTLSSISPSMRLLRVLDLQGCRNVEVRHLETICEFPLLKYLNLRGTGVTELPVSLGNLGKLETLDIRDSYVCELPESAIKLLKLRHLLSSPLNSISVTDRLPDASGMGLPRGVGNLTSLLTLSFVEARRCSQGTIRELGELTKLRKLGIVLHRQESALELCAAIEKLTGCLRSLTVWTAPRFEGPWNSLSWPLLHITSFKLGGHLEVLPYWVASLGNVTKITLYGSEIREDTLQVLRALRRLIELRLYFSAGMNISFHGIGFSSLKFLCLNADGFVQTLIFEHGAMPKLEKLSLRSYGLQEGSLNIKDLVRLKEIAVVDNWIDNDQRVMLEMAARAHPNHPRLTTVHETETMSKKIKF